MKYTKFAGKYKIDKSRVIERPAPEPYVPPVRKATFVTGACALPAKKEYTGSAVMGVATMHKSNAVPVFSADEAKELATMRRN